MIAIPPRIERRLLEHIAVDDGCWLWQGPMGRGGYGRLSYRDAGTRVFLAPHRAVYELLAGPIPEGLVLDHLCRVRHCVRPSHLEPVTIGKNVMRGVGIPVVNAAKTHCPQGHPYDAVNTYLRGGHRYCRACHRARSNAKPRQPRGRAA